MNRVMQPLFRLPGRSAVDGLSSWLGDCSVAIMLTLKQYEEGHDTAQEAAIVGTTFQRRFAKCTWYGDTCVTCDHGRGHGGTDHG